MQALEKQAGAGGDTLGNTILKLDLSVPSSLAAAWLIPADANETMRVARMKNALLHCLRQLIPFYYFADLSKFSDGGAVPSASLLVYQASTPSFDQLNNLTIQNMTDVALSTGDNDDGSLLGQVLSFWFARLSAANHPQKGFFENTGGNRNAILNAVRGNIHDFQTAGNFGRLLQTDQSVLASAENARNEMVKFLAQASNKPEEAIPHLANFGADLVTAFNSKVAGIYGGSALRPLGTLAFIEAARSLAGTSAPGTANAMLDVAVVNVDPATLGDQDPTAAQIVAENRLVAPGVLAHLPLE